MKNPYLIYTFPEAAHTKIRQARKKYQPVYIYAATGYGKTEFVLQYLGSRKYTYISCTEESGVFSVIPPEDPAADVRLECAQCENTSGNLCSFEPEGSLGYSHRQMFDAFLAAACLYQQQYPYYFRNRPAPESHGIKGPDPSV